VLAADDEPKKLAMLTYARDQYRASHARYEWLEAKAARYLTILVFVIGSANVVMLPNVREVVVRQTATLMQGAFVLSLFLLIGAAVISLFAALISMRPQTVPTSAYNPDAVITAFLSQSLADVAHGEAHQQLVSAERIAVTNEQKARFVKTSYLALLVTVTLYVLTLILWFLQI
jgi:hypothetical protein